MNILGRASKFIFIKIRSVTGSLQFSEKVSKLFLVSCSGTIKMTDAIIVGFGKIEDIDFIRQYLEACLKKSKSSFDVGIVTFYTNLAYTESKSVEEIKKYIDEIQQILKKIEKLLIKAKNSQKPWQELKFLTSINNLLLELVEDYWIYLPSEGKEKLVILQKNIRKQQNTISLNSIRVKILLLLDQFAQNKYLLTIYQKSLIDLANAIFEQAAQDLEDKIDLEEARAAKERIKTEGTISLEELRRELNLP
ncbi:MAG: hypothetical protein JO131_00950 [Gammaproteobacteria bacterium]|nr:hypothetical protein [Gammaproteobacteria bacterium]